MTGAPCGARRPHARLRTTPGRSIRRMQFAHAEQEKRTAVQAARTLNDALPGMRRMMAAYTQQAGAMLAALGLALKDMESATQDVSVKVCAYTLQKTEATL